MHIHKLIQGLKKVIVSVTNDLSTDQRVDKVCCTLSNMGFDVELVGRKLPGSFPLHRSYKTHRMSLVFKKGPLFYAEYNTRLWWYLLTHRVNLLVSNDLDTLPANFVVHKIKRIPIVYDSHEFYTETPELVNRPFVQGIWLWIEKRIFPRLTDIFTVNDSIAALYEQKYGKKLFVVRNLPRKNVSVKKILPEDLGFKSGEHLIILQGAGINIQRGAEEAIQAMEFVPDAKLLIIGGGDVVDDLKKLAAERNLNGRVIFMPRKPYNELMEYTAVAEIGLTLDKDTNINYRFSLPNKLFDYINAQTPVLASPLTEIRKIVENYKVGVLIENHDPRHIADKINFMLQNNYKAKLKENLINASSVLNWEAEEEVLRSVYSKYV